MSDLDKLFKRLDVLLDRVEKIFPATAGIETRPGFQAYRWIGGGMEGISRVDEVDQNDLLHLERQKNLLFRNTAQFIKGDSANNALLWGARGTGKSSLIKAQLSEYRDQGLCVVETWADENPPKASDLNADTTVNLLDFATLSLIFAGISTNTAPNCP